LAKGLTGGYSAVGRDADDGRGFSRPSSACPEEGRTFYHGHTFTGNPLGAAVALANIELLVEAGPARTSGKNRTVASVNCCA